MEVALGCFEDDNLLSNDDFSKPPTSGMEYLRRVQLEAQQYPDVVIGNYPKFSFDHHTNVIHIPDDPNLTKLAFPPEKCQARVASDFASLRQMFVHYKSQNIPSTIDLPAEKDRQEWQVFCFGQSGVATEHRQHSVGHPPLLSILQNINQPLAVNLLERHLEIFKTTGFSVEQGQWFFALLLCLDRPTPPDAISVLREFARHCLVFSNTLSSDHELMSHLSLFIVLVIKYFGQADLSSSLLSGDT